MDTLKFIIILEFLISLNYTVNTLLLIINQI